MGFEIPRRTARIILEDDYDGAEARCALDVDMKLYFHFVSLRNTEDIAELEKVFRDFGDRILIEWNLKENGEAIPATADGVMQLPPVLMMTIFDKWAEEVGKTPAPLSKRSRNTKRSEEASRRRRKS